MIKQSKLAGLLKIFGLLYFSVNFVVFLAICGVAIYTIIKTPQFSPGWVFLIFPGIGMFAGYWIRIGKYGWWRSLLISLSLLSSITFLFIALVIGPQMRKMEEENFNKFKKMNRVDKDVQRMFTGVSSRDINTINDDTTLLL